VQTRGSVKAQRAAYDWLQSLEGRAMILDRTRGGEELVEFMLGVLRGARLRWPELHPKELPQVQIRPTAQQRVAAATWLAERVWGTAPRVELQGEVGQTVTELPEPTAAELALLDAARRVMLEREQTAGDPDRSVIPLEQTAFNEGGQDGAGPASSPDL
jgi:hypothetical protein